MDRLSSGSFIGGESGAWQRRWSRPARLRLPAVVRSRPSPDAPSPSQESRSAQGLDESVVRVPLGRTERIPLQREHTERFVDCRFRREGIVLHP